MVKRIGDNAYKIELPDDYGVSATFNVADLSPYLDDKPLDSRTSPFEPRENDGDVGSTLVVAAQFKSHGDQGPFCPSGAEYLQPQVVFLISTSWLIK